MIIYQYYRVKYNIIHKQNNILKTIILIFNN